jgi:hypothetical protein
MTLVEFKKIIDQAGYPVAYSHFSSPPQLPYLVYLESFNPSFDADNKSFHKMADVQVELYSAKKDLTAEGKLEAVLDLHNIPYTATSEYIQSENLFQKLYEVRLI